MLLRTLMIFMMRSAAFVPVACPMGGGAERRDELIL
jgi:hypothetical protein